MFHGHAVGALEQQKKMMSVMKPAIHPNDSGKHATPMWTLPVWSLETIMAVNGRKRAARAL